MTRIDELTDSEVARIARRFPETRDADPAWDYCGGRRLVLERVRRARLLRVQDPALFNAVEQGQLSLGDALHVARNLCSRGRPCAYCAEWRAAISGEQQEHEQQEQEAPKSRPRWQYPIDDSAYEELFGRQRGRCGICAKPPEEGKRLFVDHDHETGFVRGLLCNRCNVGIGMLGDTDADLRRAYWYLEEPPAAELWKNREPAPGAERWVS